MTDIFLNYSFIDTETAAKLIAVFEQQQWNVWNESYVHRPGVAFGSQWGEMVDSAKVVVMLWSRAASNSLLVDKMREHQGQATVVPVLLDITELPREFIIHMAFDLSDWDGAASHFGLMNLLSHLHTLMGTHPPAAAPPASFERLSPSEIQEGARLGIKESVGPRPTEDARFRGVFISYRRNEAAAYAGRLYDRLAARFGRERVFLDVENIGRGADFVEAITGAAESCAVMVALISREWARGTGDARGDDDDYVRLEVVKALGRKIPLIPITIQGAFMPRAKELPDDLAPIARRNAFELRDARWERDVEDLILDLEKLLNG
jgi:hypothetical protein